MRKSDGQRAVLRTVLLVGEGYAEVAFIAHLRSLYPSRGFGLAITVKNARGTGALSVVNFAIRLGQNFDYDFTMTLLDTDAGWDDKTQNIARRGKVQVVPCNPCLEAMLLALHGEVQQGRSSSHHKHAFQNKFGKPANDISVYAKNFPKEFLEKARVKSPELESLLALLTSTTNQSP